MSTRSAAWFQTITPPPTIAGWSELLWRVDTTSRHALVPDGCVDFVWTEDGHLVVCGTEDVGWDFALSSGHTALGLRLKAGLAPALFNVPADQIVNQRVPVEDLLGRRGREITMRVNDAGDDTMRLSLLADLVANLSNGAVPDRAALAAMHWLDNEDGLRVPEAAARVGLGARQLRRRIEATFGFAPSAVRRIHRLQRFLAMGRAQPTRSIAALAQNAGYHDHQHLVRDARAIGRAAPSVLLQRTDSY